MTNRWPKNLCFLITIDYYQLSLIVIDCHQLGNISQKKYGEMKLDNDHKFVHGEHGGETE